MNLQHRTDKRRHTEKLLCDLGFSNVSFPTTTRADDVDIAVIIVGAAVLYLDCSPTAFIHHC